MVSVSVRVCVWVGGGGGAARLPRTEKVLMFIKLSDMKVNGCFKTEKSNICLYYIDIFILISITEYINFLFPVLYYH